MDALGAVGLRLRAVGALAAIISLAALVAHILGVLPMVYFLAFLGVPSVLLLFVLAGYAKWVNAGVFVRNTTVGLVGGFLATLAYDGTRALLQVSRIVDYNGFKAINIFGSWISGQPETTFEAALAGWIYHFWNGISFGIFYALIFGRRPWPYGVAYGALMEAGMLGLFPLFLRVTNRVDFIALSVIGHLVYGAVLGRIVQLKAARW